MVGFGAGGALVASYVLYAEHLPAQNRRIRLTLLYLFYALGGMVCMAVYWIVFTIYTPAGTLQFDVPFSRVVSLGTCYFMARHAC
jgi:MFS family permease